ncbi:hypothetical protein RDWZM_002223 [Blomia tropicalis]|uniref:Uncharacterized protein n=1 Tax=Blomia tropicalis TaxID=40697 RepID=A0A9Q0MER0_BLOTA|nr:hypothetical protein RDWZM_002223 [Blomia tropicalis]
MDNKPLGKVLCSNPECSKKCTGNVLRVGTNYYHVGCFICHDCKSSLAQGGFFTQTNEKGKAASYCTKCYQQSFGTKCAACNRFVEGEVVTALGNTYHQHCFRCNRCNQPFSTGEKVTWTGKECICNKCLSIPVVSSQTSNADGTAPLCNSCQTEISDGQALIALEKHWHVWCFKCETCGMILHGEYLNKDGKVYCEKDYQKLFGIKCHHCTRFITGKVLQAGPELHFHPTCARCTKCGDVFADGEEMYIQGTAIWHPRCGPGPGEKIDSTDSQLECQYYGTESPSMSSTISRSISPFGRYYRKASRSSPYTEKEMLGNDLSRYYTYSYLTAEPTQGYLRKPVDPRPPKSPQFHRPAEYHYRRRTPTRLNRHGMQVMVDTLQTGTPRPKSPAMNNEEPIELAHYPNAKKPNPSDVPTIERDDFPAPPFPYTDPQRRKYYSNDELDTINAPSRDMDRPKPWEEDNDYIDGHGTFYRNSTITRSQPYINYNMVSSLRHIPKPGYGLKSNTIQPVTNGHESPSYVDSKYLEKTQSIEFSSGKSDISITSDHNDKSFGHYMNHSTSGHSFRMTPFSEGFNGYRYASYSPHFRRSMPNVNLHQHSNEPPRQYPYHLLITNNYRLPPDVDRCHLERHLQNSEFEYLFGMNRMDFYRLPEWKRNELKKRLKLF